MLAFFCTTRSFLAAGILLVLSGVVSQIPGLNFLSVPFFILAGSSATLTWWLRNMQDFFRDQAELITTGYRVEARVVRVRKIVNAEHGMPGHNQYKIIAQGVDSFGKMSTFESVVCPKNEEVGFSVGDEVDVYIDTKHPARYHMDTFSKNADVSLKG